jgi:hypothetical protein
MAGIKGVAQVTVVTAISKRLGQAQWKETNVN